MNLFLFFLLFLLAIDAIYVVGLVTTSIVKSMHSATLPEEVEQLLLWGGLVLSAATLGILSFYLFSRP